jgi:hypothetical protein
MAIPTNLTLAQLVAGRDALITALTSPTLSAHMPDGGSVTFRSVDEIRKAIAEIEDAIREAQGAGNGSKSSLGQHRRGDGPRGPGLPWSWGLW